MELHEQLEYQAIKEIMKKNKVSNLIELECCIKNGRAFEKFIKENYKL